MCDYPKSPENKISKNINSIYNAALEQFQPNKISFIGDSVGGTLIASLTQRLILKDIRLPKKNILVTPIMDASMSNPEIGKIDDIDPMLSKIGILSAKKMCAENNDLKKVMISPLFGSFDKFPHTILFLAENDIFYPDQKLAVKKFINAKINFELIEGKNIPHIWPFLTVMKEAKISLNEIIRIINN
jgi:acetyl esterase/lipase